MGRKEMSWGWIIFFIWIFMPAGLYFLAKKSVTNSAAGTLLQAFGWGSAFMGFLVFLVMIDPEYATGGEGWTVLFFAAIAALLIGIGFKNKRRIKRCKKYIDYVVTHKVYSIDKIASLENTDYDSVLTDLKFLYNNGYLIQSSYLDIPNRVIVPRNMPDYSQNNAGNNQTGTVNTVNSGVNLSKTMTVRCSGCGANSVVVVGKVTECEYCGTLING